MELEIKAAVEQLAKDTQVAVDTKISEATKDMATKSQIADLEVKAAKLDVLEAAMREQGMKLTEMEEKAAKFVDSLDIKSILDSKMSEIENVFKSGKGDLKLDVKAAANMTTANTIDETTNSIPADLIENFTIGAFAEKRYGNQYIQNIADVTTVSNIAQHKTWLEEGSAQGAFAIVAEGGLKPLVSYDLVRNFAKAKKVAGKYVVTEEFVKFRQEAYNIIRRLIMDKMVRDYSALVTADMNAEAVAYTGSTLDDTIVAPNDYDAIGAAAAQAQSLNFNPNVLVLNPQDAWRIRLNKSTTGEYIFPVTTADGTSQIFGFQLIVSTYQTAGTFTLAESGLFKIEQEAITVRMGYGITVTGSSPVTQVVSDFDNNQMRVIVEMFFLDYLPTPFTGSIVKDTFANVKAALLKP